MSFSVVYFQHRCNFRTSCQSVQSVKYLGCVSPPTRKTLQNWSAEYEELHADLLKADRPYFEKQGQGAAARDAQ